MNRGPIRGLPAAAVRLRVPAPRRTLAVVTTLANSRGDTYRERPTSSNQPGETVTARDGRKLILRRIRRDDVAALQRGFAALTAEEVRQRFFYRLAQLPQEMAARLCDLDPRYAVAWILIDPDDVPQPEIHAVARVHMDPATEQAEFALVVQRALAGQGLGRMLLLRAFDSARALGAVEVWGDIRNDNLAMLHLCESLGCQRSRVPHDPGVVRVRLDLAAPY